MADEVSRLTPVQRDRLRERRIRFRRASFYVQAALVVCFIIAPLIVPSFRVMDVLAKIMIFTVVVASYDLIIGYTGIISFAHGMFFGLGAYSLSLVIFHAAAPQWHHLILAVLLALILSVSLALVVAFFSLRIKAIFFAMMTLALAEFVHILGYQWHGLTMGEDGMSFQLPGFLSVDWSAGPLLAGELNGRLLTYYLILVVSAALFLGLLRFVRSPVGRVLKSIRDNEQRATALGFKTFHYQVLATVFGSSIASLAGILFAMWLRYVNPDSVLGIPTMLNILLMVIIGGLGTLYSGIIGAAFLQITESWLPDLQHLTQALFPGVELVQRLAERWMLYFGVLFILVVFFFPKGIIGTAGEMLARRRAASLEGE